MRISTFIFRYFYPYRSEENLEFFFLLFEPFKLVCLKNKKMESNFAGGGEGWSDC